MKRLTLRDVMPDDSLLITFEGTFDPHAELTRELEPFLKALEEHAGDWMPDVVEGKRRRKYSRPAVWKSLEEERIEKSTSLVLGRTQWPALYMWPRISFPPLAPQLRLSIEVQPLSFFANEERCQRLVDMVRVWASRYPVTTHSSAHGLADDQLSGAPNFGRDDETLYRDGFDKIYEVSWLNVFGPRLVDIVGRERVLSTPAWRVEELPNGAVLLVLWPTPVDFASDEAREAQARAHVHLRPDLDLITVRRSLRERSATLAPVEPRFHPDVAPLLSRLVDRTAIHERQLKIAQLNPYQPPEPQEWRPADAALPEDVDEPKRTRADYATLARQLVELFHTPVPSAFEFTPESLPDIDYQLWHERFPEIFERDRVDVYAVPAVGAYLGEVLVRHLGGQWIARQEQEESQVLVGSRVWLPFARARNFLRSHQSLLDCSLTQLYHAARRHRG